MGEKTRPGDGVVAGSGLVDGRPMFCYAQDASYVGGSLGEAHADSIVRVLQLAGRAQAPVVAFVGSGGARMQEGIAGLSGYGRIFRETVRLSGKVPQISIITGLSAGGGAYSP
jgi:acetyl-CoA carboxylase carboxyltransferase component